MDWAQALAAAATYEVARHLQDGQDVNAIVEERMPALQLAAKRGQLAIVRLLLAQPGIEIPDNTLHIAAAAPGPAGDLVRVLLAAGASATAALRWNGSTPLHFAASGEAAAALIAGGADAAALNSSSAGSLIVAAEHGHADVVAELLGAGVPVDQPNMHGATPLFKAADKGHLACVELLVAAGASLGARDANGLTPLHQACNRDHAPCALALLRAGADPNAPDKYGKTPLLVGSWHPEVAALMARSGADWRAVRPQLTGSFAYPEGAAVVEAALEARRRERRLWAMAAARLSRSVPFGRAAERMQLPPDVVRAVADFV